MTPPSEQPDPDDEPDEPDDDGDNDDGDNDDGDDGTTARLSAMTKQELLDYADENGIMGVDGGMKKADILATIEG